MTPQFLMRIIAAIFRFLSYPFVRFEFRGGACVDDYTNWVMSANHRSVYDFALALIGLDHFRRYARVMVASEFFAQPHFAWAVNAIDAIPVYRTSDPRGALSAAIAALEAGDSTCIMPEGTLRWNGDTPLEMGPIKTGVSRLAVGSDTPVLCIALVGTERIWQTGANFFKVAPTLRWRRHVICRLADEPLWLDGEDHRANAEKVKAATEALVRQATADLQALDPSYLPGVDPGVPPEILAA